MPTLRRRSLVRWLADRVELHGKRRREDLSRLAQWRLETGGEIDAEVLVGGARLALAGRDTDAAIRLARAAADGAPGEAAIVLAEAYEMLGRPADVAAAMATVSGTRRPHRRPGRPPHPQGHRDPAGGGSDIEGALQANDGQWPGSSDPVSKASLIAHRSWVLANSGRPLEALAAPTGCRWSTTRGCGSRWRRPGPPPT